MAHLRSTRLWLAPLLATLGCGGTKEFCETRPAPSLTAQEACGCDGVPDSFCVCAEKLDCELRDLAGSLGTGLNRQQCQAQASQTCQYEEQACATDPAKGAECLGVLDEMVQDWMRNPGNADGAYGGFRGTGDPCSEVFVDCDFGI